MVLIKHFLRSCDSVWSNYILLEWVVIYIIIMINLAYEATLWYNNHAEELETLIPGISVQTLICIKLMSPVI